MPHQHQLKRNINGVVILAEVARERGLGLPALLAGSGLQPADLDDPSATLSFEDEFRIIRNLLAHCGDPAGLGLEVGRRYRFTSLAAVGFALVSSPDLRSAFDITLRYADLNASLVRVFLARADADLPIGFADVELPRDLRRFAVERTAAVALTIARDLLGRAVTPAGLHFSFAAPPDPRVYLHFAGVMPVFDAPASVLTLKAEDADAPLLHGNPLALQMAEESCRRLLSAWKLRRGLAAQVREKVLARPGRIADMSAVAAALQMSVRTMRRRLAEEGTNYLALCEEARLALALELLAVPRLPIERIAERLGYSEASSFIHAFKRWKGQTPQAFRQGGAVGG